MDPDSGRRPDPGDGDESSSVELLLETSSDASDVSDFSNSGDRDNNNNNNNNEDGDIEEEEIIEEPRDREGNRFDDFDNGDEYDDDLSRPDPSDRGYDEKPDPFVDGRSEFDVENQGASPSYEENVVEDDFFPSASVTSDGEVVQVIEEVIDYPPEDDDDPQAPRSGETFDDEESKSDDGSQKTSRERRIITFLSIAVCILILLIFIAIGVGIGRAARNRNRVESGGGGPTEFPTLAPTATSFPSQFTTFNPTVEDTVTSKPTITSSPTVIAQPTSVNATTLAPTTTNSTSPPVLPIPPSLQPPVAPSVSPPPVEPTAEPAPSTVPAVGSPPPSFHDTELFQLLADNSLDDGETISTPGTPQNEAYQWLRSNAFLSTYSDDQILQRYALAVFFYSTEGPTAWDPVIRDDGWVTDAPECEWASTVNNQCTNGTYTSLTIDYVGVSGTLPDELSLLTGLERLSVRSSDEAMKVITGTIPESIGMLTNMQTVRLNNNALEGPIPSTIGLMTNARVIVLPGNNLTGPIPFGLANTQARTINFANNQLESSIPPELFTLEDLTAINLENNQLTGVIPAEIGSSSSLSAINFSKNKLVGVIPKEIGQLSKIRSSIDFSDNRLSGTLPSEIGMLFRMRSFEVQNNELAGTVPPELSGLTEIELFRIDGNPGIVGSMPEAVCETFGISTVSFSDCGGSDLAPSFECKCCTFCCTGGLCECNIDDADLCAESLIPDKVSERR